MRFLNVAIFVFFLVAASAHSSSSRRRSARRRRSGGDSISIDGLAKEMRAMRKELRKAKEELETLKSAFKVDPEKKLVAIADWNLQVFGTKDGVGNVIIGGDEEDLRHDTRRARNSFFTGETHSATGEGNVFLGGVSNQANGRFEWQDGSGKWISENIESNGNVFLGGSANWAVGDHNVVAGGQGNFAGEETLQKRSGGRRRLKEWSEGTNCYRCFVAGGSYNRARGEGAVAIGGGRNFAGGANAVAVGGWANNVSSGGDEASTILGGRGNKLDDARYAVIVGGDANKIISERGEAWNAVLVGGRGNVVKYGSTQATIVGGQINTVTSGVAPTIIGGEMNTNNALNYIPTLTGGFNNSIETDWGSMTGGRNYIMGRDGSTTESCGNANAKECRGSSATCGALVTSCE